MVTTCSTASGSCALASRSSGHAPGPRVRHLRRHLRRRRARRCGQVAEKIDEGTIVFIVCDGGWKYLSTGAWTDDLDDVEPRPRDHLLLTLERGSMRWVSAPPAGTEPSGVRLPPELRLRVRTKEQHTCQEERDASGPHQRIPIGIATAVKNTADSRKSTQPHHSRQLSCMASSSSAGREPGDAGRGFSTDVG